jgi:hypothetical protein
LLYRNPNTLGDMLLLTPRRRGRGGVLRGVGA